MKIFNLQCEYRNNPLGISVKEPRFSWKVSSNLKKVKQTHYRIFVYKKMLQSHELVWDSGKTAGEKPFGIAYSGEELTIYTQYIWSVEIWDNYGNKVVSDDATFETGIFSLNDWHAKWITAKEAENCIHARTSFTIPKEKKILSARLYSASTAGAFGNISFAINTVYLTLNGKKVGNDAIMPGQVSINHWRAVYRTYDITEELIQGENAVGVVLVSMAYSAFVRVCFTDGTSETFLLADTFKVNGSGPYHLWDIGVGEQGGKMEDYNPFLEYKGFDEPTYDDSEWSIPVFTDIVTSLGEQVTTIEKIDVLKPVFVKDKWERHYLVDFGQVIHGHIRLIIKNPKIKERVSIVYSEGIFPNEELDFYSTVNYHHGENGPHKDTYITKGESESEIFEPKFSNHSFRYVDVYNYPGELKAENIFAILIHSPVLSDSSFCCSDLEINQLYSISYWSQRDNLVSVPTDCPSRERLGWMGDAWMCGEAEMLNFNLLTFMEFWCQNIMDDQYEDGYIPFICPPPNPLTGVDVPWSSACILVPWFTYERYGDDSILHHMYPVMEKWIDFIGTLANENCELIGGIKWGDHTQQVASNSNFLAMVYYYICCTYIQKVCNIIGKNGDKYAVLAQGIAESIKRLYKTETGISNNTQGEVAHALAIDIIDRKRAIELIEENLKSTQYLLTCGGMGIYHLITELNRSERHDLIYKICKCDLEGSFLSWIKNHNATTSFEFLHYYGSASKNHPFLMGSVTSWFYQGLGGIRSTSPGYKTFDIQPYLPEDMSFVHTKVETMYGLIEVKYQREASGYLYEVYIPFGTKAKVKLLNGCTIEGLDKDEYLYILLENNEERYIELGSGYYCFRLR